MLIRVTSRFKNGLTETRRPKSSDRETVNQQYNQLFHPDTEPGPPPRPEPGVLHEHYIRSLTHFLQASCNEPNLRKKKKYSLQEDFGTKTKYKSNNPFRKFLKSKSLKDPSFEGDLDMGDLTLLGSMSIIECSCGHNSCPNCNLTYM